MRRLAEGLSSAAVVIGCGCLYLLMALFPWFFLGACLVFFTA